VGFTPVLLLLTRTRLDEKVVVLKLLKLS